MREKLVPGYSQAINDHGRRKHVLPTTTYRVRKDGGLSMPNAAHSPAMIVKPACDFYLDRDNLAGEPIGNGNRNDDY